MEKFERNKLPGLEAELKAAIEAVAQKHGLSVTMGGGSYTTFEYKPKLILRTKSEAADVQSGHIIEALGGKREWVNKEFTTKSGERYRVTGANPRKSKMPISLVNVATGREASAAIGYVAQLLG